MELLTCTITGADDHVNISDMERLSREYPFAEWALLLSPSSNPMTVADVGKPRYPTMKRMLDLLTNHEDMNYSVHLCKDYVESFLSGNSTLWWMLSYADRVQLNINCMSAAPGIENRMVMGITQFASTMRGRKVLGMNVITQQNISNTMLTEYLLKSEYDRTLLRDAHQVLFDSSGGKGVEAKTFKAPYHNVVCGYAGGLGPSNLEYALGEIERIAGDEQVWTDMESAVRTNNELDLQKVEECLRITSRHL